LRKLGGACVGVVKALLQPLSSFIDDYRLARLNRRARAMHYLVGGEEDGLIRMPVLELILRDIRDGCRQLACSACEDERLNYFKFIIILLYKLKGIYIKIMKALF
jgi:hypothetical protein